MGAKLAKVTYTVAHLGDSSSLHLRLLAERQAKRGHIVHIISDDRERKPKPIHGVIFHGYSHAERGMVRARQVRGILKEIGPDLLHAHYLNVGGFLGVMAGFHPILIHGWGSDVLLAPHYSVSQRIKSALALRAADAVVSPARALQSKMTFLAGGLARNAVIPWGIDTDFFWSGKNSGNFRRQMGLGAEPFVLSPRGLSPLYNQDVLLGAWAKVLQEVPKAKLVILRFNTDPVFAKTLLALAQEKYLEASLVWSDALDQESLRDAYVESSAVVSIPSSDAPAMTVLEAMSCGATVLASDLPALREYIEPGVNGYLQDPRDAGALARTLTAVLRQSDSPIGAGARETVIRNASLEESLSRFDELYQTVVGSAEKGWLQTARNLVRAEGKRGL